MPHIEPSPEEFRERVREALYERVCRVCVDRQPSGPPCTFDGEPCCLFGHLEPVVDAVLRSFDLEFRPYLMAIREHVCASCDHQRPDGTCPLRKQTLCPLNNYLPLVVEAIEAVRYRS